jgi:hypothetical protein
MGVCEAAAESSIKKSKQLLQTVYNNSSVLLKLYSNVIAVAQNCKPFKGFVNIAFMCR